MHRNRIPISCGSGNDEGLLGQFGVGPKNEEGVRSVGVRSVDVA